MTQKRVDWQIAVFCQNDRRTIADCLASISSAVGHRNALITLMINGSTDGSEEVARVAVLRTKTPIRIFRIRHADKSHAINTFLHDRSIRVDADIYFGVNAYVRIYPDALKAMSEALEQQPFALTATGVATTGRSEPKAHQATVGSGAALHGQFYALRRSFVESMVARGLRLPIGICWGDGLLGAMAAHNLDCLHQPWLDERLITVAAARFATNPLSPFRLRDVHRQLRRKVRQNRGRLQTAAIKKLVYQRGYSALPEFADDLVREFLATNDPPKIAFVDRPFMAISRWQDRTKTRPLPDSLCPVRVM